MVDYYTILINSNLHYFLFLKHDTSIYKRLDKIVVGTICKASGLQPQTNLQQTNVRKIT